MMVRPTLEPAVLGIELKQAVDGLGDQAGGLRETFCRTARWSRQS